MNQNMQTQPVQRGYQSVWHTSQSQVRGCLLALSQSPATSTTAATEVHDVKTDLIAALYGLHFKVQPLILNISVQSQMTETSPIWVEQSQKLTADEFDTELHKVIQYFEIDSFCIIHIEHGEAKICIGHQQQQSHSHIPVDQVEQILQEKFYGLCVAEDIPLIGRTYHMGVDVEYRRSFEPQTNLGKMARDIRIKNILERMN